MDVSKIKDKNLVPTNEQVKVMKIIGKETKVVQMRRLEKFTNNRKKPGTLIVHLEKEHKARLVSAERAQKKLTWRNKIRMCHRHCEKKWQNEKFYPEKAKITVERRKTQWKNEFDEVWDISKRSFDLFEESRLSQPAKKRLERKKKKRKLLQMDRSDRIVFE